MPLTDIPVESATSEPLSCTACRNRKLKCDRAKPACARCVKSSSECVYPESRRKPAFKRRNVRELEARLAQVEVLLREAGEKNRPAENSVDASQIDFNFAGRSLAPENVFFQGLDYPASTEPQDSDAMFSANDFSLPFASMDASHAAETSFGGELIDLGISEPLPSFEVLEELNRIYFDKQQQFTPIIHPARYFKSFYSPPHMKPPMCLQYAIWALACNGHEKYNALHEYMYQRARKYAEEDEMRGYGEHFITVSHAQAWCLITTDEAKSMLFTRAAMSSAKAVRLVEMMGLHRLDGPSEDTSPTLLPSKDWLEIEERRRAFWGVFCVDSHCSISTGWPQLIDPSEITTHLPASETAFSTGQQIETCSLENAFKGAQYSSFAGAILVCHLFNKILKHVHRPKPNDNPQNYDFGDYWQRHREIDNTLSSAFMFLPEHFRLPENYREPTAIHTNLNFHASIICLHLAAIERIDKYKLPAHVKKASQSRLLMSAQEIVSIMRLTSHVKSHPKSPMAALSLYCAASVYIYQCKETKSAKDIDNLDFIISAMDAIGREHVITRAFLKQVVLDIHRNNITDLAKLPRLDNLPGGLSMANGNIPLLARSNVSRHSEVQPPLPGRLPLGRPQGKVSLYKMRECGIGFGSAIEDSNSQDLWPVEEDEVITNKRKRTAAAGGGQNQPEASHSVWAGRNVGSSASTSMEPIAATTTSQQVPVSGLNQAPPSRQPSMINQPLNQAMSWSGISHNLPDRSGSPAANSAPTPAANMRRGVQVGHDMIGPGGPPIRTAGRGADGVAAWDMTSTCMYAQFGNQETIGRPDLLPVDASWVVGTEQQPPQANNVNWGAIAAGAVVNLAAVPGHTDINGGQRSTQQ
ncbi:hypothetical protein BX600DRAFT_509177 [Xylariales sp. PMI_506]|nr:hypothetical protein BX600DRAFT_509177 [Xylariales sp. PMI_506]